MNRKLALIGLLTGVASVLFTLESLVSLPIPWFRLGLANAVTLLALDWWGIRETLAVVVLRTVLGSVMMGRLFHPDFVFSFAGGIASALAMWPLIRFGRRWFGYVGISIFGALVKNATQWALAYFLFVRQIRLLSILPFFLGVSLLSGLIVGFLASLVNRGYVSHFSAGKRKP